METTFECKWGYKPNAGHIVDVLKSLPRHAEVDLEQEWVTDDWGDNERQWRLTAKWDKP